MNPMIQQFHDRRKSLWLDNISRKLLSFLAVKNDALDKADGI